MTQGRPGVPSINALRLLQRIVLRSVDYRRKRPVTKTFTCGTNAPRASSSVPPAGASPSAYVTPDRPRGPQASDLERRQKRQAECDLAHQNRTPDGARRPLATQRHSRT
jgi:hypothetical protein